MSRIKMVVAGLAGAVLLAACTSDPTAPAADTSTLTGQKLHEAAQVEGELVIYGPTEDLFAPVYEDFNEAYPGISIQTQDIFGQELDAKLEGENAAGTMIGDMVHIATPELERLLAAGFLSATEAEGSDGLAEEFHGPDANWLVSSLHLYATMFNTQQVPEAARPSTWSDINTFEGTLGMSNPVSPGGQAQMFASALDDGVIDDAWLVELAEKRPRVYPSVANVGQAVVSGEIDMSLVAGYGTFQRLSQGGAPVEFLMLDDGSYFTEVGYSKLEGARHPAAAKLLVSWILSEEGQASIAEHVYEYGTMPGAPAPAGMPSLEGVERLDYPGEESFTATLDRLAELFGN